VDYVVPSQVQQVFFYPNTSGANWRTVLHKEARSTHVFADCTCAEYTIPVDDSVRLHTELAWASKIENIVREKRK
jgi:hypothetical protein